MPSTEENRRYTIKHIHTADDKHDVQGLVDKVSKKTVAEIVSHLKKPDVLVTNAKDKETILPMIQKIDEKVIQVFNNRVKKLQSPQSPPALTQLLKNESGEPDTSDKAVDSLFVKMDSDKNGWIDKSELELTQAVRGFEGGSEPASPPQPKSGKLSPKKSRVAPSDSTSYVTAFNDQ